MCPGPEYDPGIGVRYSWLYFWREFWGLYGPSTVTRSRSASVKCTKGLNVCCHPVAILDFCTFECVQLGCALPCVRLFAAMASMFSSDDAASASGKSLAARSLVSDVFGGTMKIDAGWIKFRVEAIEAERALLSPPAPTSLFPLPGPGRLALHAPRRYGDTTLWPSSARTGSDNYNKCVKHTGPGDGR